MANPKIAKEQPEAAQEPIDKVKEAAQKILTTGQYKELWSNPQGHFFSQAATGELTLEPGEQLNHHTLQNNE